VRVRAVRVDPPDLADLDLDLTVRVGVAGLRSRGGISSVTTAFVSTGI